MQFTTITTALFALATVAIAAPTEIEARTEGSCTNEQPNQICCSVGLLSCVLQVLGQTCGGQAYCCNNNVLGNGGLINVDLLNCAQIL
ncbi:hypothetical protein M426DRAFT_321837 [Hypoxylon sp. CI-4A]|nr:hypothetical protein M426DRAFT_321837 [Hypoxylon sp. CI-4A]